MTGKALIVQNVAREGPGLIGEVLNKRKYWIDIIDFNGKDFPELSNYDVAFALGGPDSANDETTKMKEELQIVKEIIKLHIPYFGVCLGMQILVKTAGGDVFPNKIKEIGCRDSAGSYYEVELTADGMDDTIFNGINSTFKIFQLHGETVALKDNMKLLGIGKHCKNQIVKIGNCAYGIQGHPEVTETMLREWLAEDSMFDKYDKNAILKDCRDSQEEYESNGLRLINNFLDIAEKQNKEIAKIGLNNQK